MSGSAVRGAAAFNFLAHLLREMLFDWGGVRQMIEKVRGQTSNSLRSESFH